MISIPIWLFILLCVPFACLLILIIIYIISETIERVNLRKFRKNKYDK